TVTGIDAYDIALVTSNTVFGHSVAGAVGINARNVTVSDNAVYGNTLGIQAFDALALHNRAYGNTIGIRGRSNATIEANQIYSNSIGISGDPFGGFTGLISNNLVYGNTSRGIFIERAGGPGIRIINNTVHQAVGDAVRIENNAHGTTLRNNVIWVDSGYDIYVAANSQTAFSSNYNLLHQGIAPQAHVGFWGGVDRHSLGDWQSATGQDMNSLAGDPLWVDRDGPDNVLGYTTAGGGYDGGLDDNFHLRGSSPAIDRADATLAPTLDRDGLPRADDPGTMNAGTPAGLAYVDLGAHEFQGSSTDVTPPTILSTAIRTLGTTNNLVHEIQISFSEPLDSLDAGSVGNYEFRAAGPNGIFGDADDTLFELVPHYTAGSTSVTLDIISGDAILPVGMFQLTVRGSTHDVSGNALDGDQNGQPGGDYVRSNGRPVMNPIPDRTIPERQLFAFTVTASDNGSLTYSLANGAPAGASIDPVSGVFTWTPTEAQGPGIYAITVIATDNGSPVMNDLRTFTLTVAEVNPFVADFNQDGLINVLDIDALVGQIAAHTNPGAYDLTGDGLVNLSDRDVWLALAGEVNLPSGNPYRLGDANLDGVVDGSDFGRWNANKFTFVAAWSKGDFNADGAVDGSDFGTWNANKFTSSDAGRPAKEAQVSLTELAATEINRRLKRVDQLFGDFGTWSI
ncbi:MAG TPA: putative Ig domain-containing protein, partial [Pirellulaceae bacterium]